jgi:hypothetical protein
MEVWKVAGLNPTSIAMHLETFKNNRNKRKKNSSNCKRCQFYTVEVALSLYMHRDHFRK